MPRCSSTAASRERSDSRLGRTAVNIHSVASKNTVDILVENGGRINFQKRLREERKGIVGVVTLSGMELKTWHVYPLPMKEVPKVAFKAGKTGSVGPSYLHGRFYLSSTGDTYLDMRGMTKGAVWVNGHALGRFWNIGPQYTLYVPGPWLKTGANDVVIFDLNGKANLMLKGVTRPVYGQGSPSSP